MYKFKLLFLAFFLSVTLSFSQSIPLSLSKPVNVGACTLNSYVAHFPGTGAVQRISIQSSVFLNGNNAPNCGTSNGSLVVVDSIKENGVSISATNIVLVLDSGKWTGTLPSADSSDTITIYYHILIDCSVIPVISPINSMSLIQNWQDSLPGVAFNINATGFSADTSNNIKYPILVNNSSTSYALGYRDTLDIKFVLKNTGTGPASIYVTLDTVASLCSGDVDMLAFYYQKGVMGTPVQFNPADSFFVDLAVNDTLILTQWVSANTCLDACGAEPVLTWRCAVPPLYDTLFCDSCRGFIELPYSLFNEESPKLLIERILPVSDYVASFDTSCVNDPSAMREWKFKIRTSGKGLLDSSFVYFFNSDINSFNSMSLIPRDSIEIVTFFNSPGCSMDTLSAINNKAYCSGDVADPLAYLNMVLYNFGENDSLLFSFKTYRCVEENDSLFNVPKYFTTGRFEGSYSKSICGTSLPVMGDTLYSKLNIADHLGANVNQSLIYNPTVTDLSASVEKALPLDSLWGDSAQFEIELKGYLHEIIDNQLFGCFMDSLSYCIPQGYLRVNIETGAGLAASLLDSSSRLRYVDSMGQMVMVLPEYYYSAIPNTACIGDSVSLYFPLSAPGVLQALKNGFFDFTLKSCCGGPPGGVNYSVKFAFLLNPSGSCNSLSFPGSGHTLPPLCSGIGCDWLPLSKVEDEIVVHCPGCVTPGIVISNYNIRRIRFGLQDSNNDGKADNSNTLIEEGTAWFDQHKLGLKPHYAGFGDCLEDRLCAYFSAGDPGAGGFSYPMMQTDSANLNYLQLSRRIPQSDATVMNLTVDSLTIYIDTPDSGGVYPCYDCSEFNLDSNRYSTQRMLKVAASDLVSYMTRTGEYYLITLSSRDSSGMWVGNLHDPAFTIYSRPIDSLAGFFEHQRYRIRVNYGICGNFIMAENDLITDMDDVRKESEIQNKMWLTGEPKPYNAFDVFDAQPASLELLQDSGWYFTGDTVRIRKVDSSFANEYLFICEDFGGKIYFFSHDGRNYTSVDNVEDDCKKNITISSESRVAGNLLTIYPYEYHPGSIQAAQYMINVPQNYYVSSATLKNTINLDDSAQTQSIPLMLSDTTGFIIIHDSLFTILPCLYDTSVTDATFLYFGSGYTHREIVLEIAPISCGDTLLFTENDSIVRIMYSGSTGTCLSKAGCVSSYRDTVSTLPFGDSLFITAPNDTILYTAQVAANSTKMCFPFTLSNPAQTQNGITSTYAPNYFLVVPDSTEIPWLTGWVLTNSSGDTIPVVDSIFQIDSVLQVGESGQYQLCAWFISCPAPEDTLIDFQLGWNCNGFPTIDKLDSVCSSNYITFIVHPSLSQLEEYRILIDRDTISYSLCQAFSYKNCFKSVENGDVHPRYFLIDQPPSQLAIVSVVVNRDTCDPSSAQVPLQALYPDSNIYVISDSALIALNYTDTVLHQGDCLCGVVTLQSQCDADTVDLPGINLFGTGYCGDTISIFLQNYFTAKWDSTSHCHDCFVLTKSIVPVDTIHVGDTITFELKVHSNNGTQEVVYLADLFPAGFVPLDTLPAYIITPPQGDTSIFISGYYTQTSTCPGGENIGRLIFNEYDAYNQPSGIDTSYATACQDVISKCITSSTIILADGDFASNGYLSSYVDTVLYLAGTFYVDMNMYFENCIIKTKAGSSIVLLGTNRLDFYNTTISGCDSMWQGIIVDYNGTVNLESGNSIQDANEGVNLGEKGNLSMINSEIINSVTGVRVPPQSSYFGGSVDFRQARFGMYASAFLPDYVGQPTHGVLPYAGINIDDASLNIGDDSYGACTFHKMNIGIRGYTSDLEINNCVFDSIRATYFYNSKGNASAVVGIGDTANFIPSYIRVNPLPNPGTSMDYCENGIYTLYSELRVAATEMDHMRNGIDVHQCKDPLSTYIEANTIRASHYGVMMHDNHKGAGLYVKDNIIEIDGFKGGMGILAEELVKNASVYYEINGNQIHLVNAAAGVQVNSVREASITYNTVDIDTGIGTAPINAGVQLNASDSCVVSCNQVFGYIDADVKCKGYLFSQSPRNTIQCNVADTVGYGFYFGGAACVATTFRGNFMGGSYSGLYLNSEANIGQQPNMQNPPYHGNIWVDSTRYLSGYGAVNLNTFQNNLLLSLFTTYQFKPSHNPIIPNSVGDAPFYVNDQQWFSTQNLNSSFNCDSSSICSTYEPGSGGEEYRQMVAEEDAVSSVFIPESKIIAQQFLYQELKQDSVLLNSNVIYEDFVDEKEGESVGKLYEVEREMMSVSFGDSSFSSSLLASNNQIEVYADSIRYLDSLLLLTPSILLQQQKESIINLLMVSRSSLSTAGSQLKSNDNIRITSALSKNYVVEPSQLPDANEKFINDVTLRYKAQGISMLLNEYEPVLQVAVQCPYSGGAAVYQARALIRLINDTIEYNDDDVCEVLGIYRVQTLRNESPAKRIKIIPNPSNGNIQIVYSGLTDSEIRLEVTDVLGRIVHVKTIGNVSSTCQLQLSALREGLYSLKLSDNKGNRLTEKLIITK